ncbi:uncharacterized protein LOC113136927 isoform X10 [Xyrichtys novacula]|uniref:Uncharacterized protein LOC113136927 isoform X10 n=1 Tax=Xyrichtys novacula TaxID=13765 RepID=A0AAV1GXS3_XYRNO|nr:uncharacterized protein LOC113136927 isoform X10 [Xyrichtys novacula]
MFSAQIDVSFSVFLIISPSKTVTEEKNGDRVTLRCSVLTYKHLKTEVEWLFKGEDVDEHHQTVGTSQHLCYADVTFQPDHLMYRSRYESLQCEVTVGDKEELFPFRLQSSATEASVTLETPTTTATVSANDSSSNLIDWLWLYVTLAVLVLMTLLIVAVIVIRWKKTKGTKTQKDGDVANDPKDDVAYASIGFTKKSSSQARVLGKVDGDEDDSSVTCVTVKASTSSSAAAV